MTDGRPVDGHLREDERAGHPYLASGGFVTFTVVGFGDFDPVLVVRDADGDVLGENDDTIGLDSQLVLDLDAGDTVTLEVRELVGDAGDYVVSADPGQAGEAAAREPIDGGRLERGGSASGTILGEQVARYDIRGGEGPITIAVLGQDGFDPVVRVLAADGSLIAENDDFGGSLDAQVEVELPEGSNGTVEVEGFGGQAGRYTISAR